MTCRIVHRFLASGGFLVCTAGSFLKGRDQSDQKPLSQEPGSLQGFPFGAGRSPSLQSIPNLPPYPQKKTRPHHRPREESPVPSLAQLDMGRRKGGGGGLEGGRGGPANSLHKEAGRGVTFPRPSPRGGEETNLFFFNQGRHGQVHWQMWTLQKRTTSNERAT